MKNLGVFVAFLLILLALPSISNASYSSLRAQGSHNLSEPNYSSSEERGVSIASTRSYLKYAFFPREPRLQDLTPISGFAPVGIASYGSSSNPVKTNAVKGETSISGIGIGFFSGEEINYSTATPYTGIGNATLQENAVLWMGNLGTYWTQNVIFITQNSQSSYTLQLVNNVWNFTSITANMNQLATNGTGQVQCMDISGVTSCFYYSVDQHTFIVTSPFEISLSMLAISGSSAAVSVQFQYQISDSSGQNLSGQYDDVQLYPLHSPVTSYFQIGGSTPLSANLGGGTTLTLPSDLELVLGGPGGGSQVFVNSIDGSQKLLYMNGTSYVPVRDAYSIGSDTAEEASGVTVSPKIVDPSSPQAVLTSGPVSAQKLWPLPISIFLTGTNIFQNSTLSIRGQALYSINSSSRIVPASNLTILESHSGSTLQTDTNGRFGVTFAPNSVGTFNDTFSYGGSIAFYPVNMSVEIAVSSINVTSVASGELVAILNSTRVLIQNSESIILVPVLSGSSVVATFQNVSSGSEERDLFLGFGNSSSLRNLENTIVFFGNSSQSVTTNFLTQYLVTIENSYTGQDFSQWYNQSSTVDFSAPSTVLKGGQLLTFSGWIINGGTGAVFPSSNSSLVVNEPLVISAEYVYSSAIPYEIVIGIVTLIAGIFVGYFVNRRRHAI